MYLALIHELVFGFGMAELERKPDLFSLKLFSVNGILCLSFDLTFQDLGHGAANNFNS